VGLSARVFGRRVAAGACLGAILIVGAVDSQGTAEGLLSALYLVPVALGAWRIGRPFGLALAVFSALTSYLADGPQRRFVDDAGQFCIFIAVVLLVGRLKEQVGSELRYRRLFESAKDGILILDAETGRVVDVNPFLVELLGYSRDSFRGKYVWEVGLFKDTLASEADFRELGRVGYVHYGDLTLECRYGQRIEVEFVSNTYLEGDEKVIQCNLRDITERRRAADALSASRQIIEGIINAIPARVFWKDKTLVFLGCNTAFAQDAGFADAKDVIGKDDYQMVWREQAESYRAYDQRVIESGRSIPLVEESQSTPKGDTITVLTSKVPLRDSNGEVNGVIGTYLDITDLKRAQEAHARLARAVEQSAEAIVITDAGGSIVYANPAFEKTTGYTREEAVGQNPRILKSGKQDAAFYREMWSVLSRGDVWRGRMTNKKKDGTLFEEDATISSIRDAAGKVVNYVAVKRDITNEMLLEQQLMQAQKMEAIGRLAGGVAHDFNNLLGVILGYGEIVHRALADDHSLKGKLEQVLKAGERAADLTRQLLAFGRKQVLQPKILDLNAVVSNMQKMLPRVLGEDVELATTLEPLLGSVMADPGQVEQVLMNLAVNARDALPDGGRITIETRNADLDESYAATHAPARAGSYVMLAVNDTGTGMDAATQARIFEPFFTTKKAGQGTGLGLSTVYGIVKQSGGYVWVYSEVGVGTTFKIYFPRIDEAPEKTRAEGPRPLLGGTETVLLVEDEASFREMLTEVLGANGYSVLAARNGSEALQIAAAHTGPIELMISDVIMPGMTGPRIVDLVAQTRRDLKVLYISGYSDEAVIQHGLIGPRRSFLSKPFTPELLLRRVRESLDAGGERTLP
jgi:two-component system, cell cycle sensor histidine kinase and response regulator CckA